MAGKYFIGAVNYIYIDIHLTTGSPEYEEEKWLSYQGRSSFTKNVVERLSVELSASFLKTRKKMPNTKK